MATAVQTGSDKGKRLHNSLFTGILVEIPKLCLHLLDMRGHERTNTIRQDILETLFVRAEQG